MSVRILQGDALSVLQTLPDESVHCVVTSPPYWGLRDYGINGQVGLESTPAEYVAKVVAIFSEVKRVLRDDGTLWLNLGDSYAGSWGAQSRPNGNDVASTLQGASMLSARQIAAHPKETHTGSLKNTPGLKPKDLCGMPWRVAFALQADGWYLRQDIIWSKPNPMPESARDRCTKAHEYIFLLAKSERYYFDAEAIQEPAEGWNGSTFDGDRDLEVRPTTGRGPRKRNDRFGGNKHGADTTKHSDGSVFTGSETRNKRSVWTVTTQPFKEAHFATFPPALIEPCILAGCPSQCCAKCGAPWKRQVERTPATVKSPASEYGNGAGRNDGNRSMLVGASSVTTGFAPSCACNEDSVPGSVLDPFGGAGTTGLVADRHGRNAILIELNPEYCEMARKRITGDAPLFAEVAA